MDSSTVKDEIIIETYCILQEKLTGKNNPNYYIALRNKVYAYSEIFDHKFGLEFDFIVGIYFIFPRNIFPSVRQIKGLIVSIKFRIQQCLYRDVVLVKLSLPLVHLCSSEINLQSFCLRIWVSVRLKKNLRYLGMPSISFELASLFCHSYEVLANNNNYKK